MDKGKKKYLPIRMVVCEIEYSGTILSTSGPHGTTDDYEYQEEDC